MTKDIDVTIGADLDALEKVLDMVRNLGLEILAGPERFTCETMVLPCRDVASGIRLDFMFPFSAYEREALERAREVQIGASPVRFASPEDLVIHKIIAGRPRDLEDVRGVLRKTPELDRQCAERWLGVLGRGRASRIRNDSACSCATGSDHGSGSPYAVRGGT